MAVKTGRIYCGRWTQRAAVTHLVGLSVNGTFVILGLIDRKEYGEESVALLKWGNVDLDCMYFCFLQVFDE